MATSSSTQRKKIDKRIKLLVEQGVKHEHRTFFIIVGNKAREQVVNLHFMLSRARVRARPNVLWCYNKDLGFITDDKSRFKKLKDVASAKQSDTKTLEEIQQQLIEDPFNLFLSTTQIRFCLFKESQKILGNTYGMLVIQDFEGITPNILARTMETIEGGGIITLLLPNMKSLKQLYTMNMDIHSRFRIFDQNNEITARFNERFLLSLSKCGNCLVVDDELNILPISSAMSRQISEEEIAEEEEQQEIVSEELTQLKTLLKDTPFVGTLMNKLVKTVDQGKSLLSFVELISEKQLQGTAVLTAARGRGKSATLGLSIATAIAYGYSNIFVTAPAPDNVQTLFQFIIKGLEALDYKEQTDYEIIQSTNPQYNNAMIRIHIFKQNHRQIVQYIFPNMEHAQVLQNNCELLVIDEAAAIPLPIVKSMLSNQYLLFLSSTINGYEGTGRSLSLKLIQQLKEQGNAKHLIEMKLEEPIRYKSGDPIEKWLYDLLCLDATSAVPITNQYPHPSQCQLYHVNRDTLFSFHEASEQFLHNMMSLYVSSHYKNTPNDLQIMSDAPNHLLFVLLGPIDENTTSLPDIYCVLQVCLEGSINRQVLQSQMSRGENPTGDLIPYLISRQFQEMEFASLTGVRVVRIATHPEYQRMGYASRALELLHEYYFSGTSNSGDTTINEEEIEKEEEEATTLTQEMIRPRDKKYLPPLLQTLSERRAELIDYLGVSYGMTQKLFNFWRRNNYIPVYIRLTENELTGEHTCVMIKTVNQSTNSNNWLEQFSQDFKKRFLQLLSFDLKKFSPQLALSVLDYRLEPDESMLIQQRKLTLQEYKFHFSKFDLKRLTSYSKNLLDYHVILDTVPTLAQLFFCNKIPVNLSYTQAAILVAVGLEKREIGTLYQDLGLQSNQVLALFNKTIRKFVKYLSSVHDQVEEVVMVPETSKKRKFEKEEEQEEKEEEEEEKQVVKKDDGEADEEEIMKLFEGEQENQETQEESKQSTKSSKKSKLVKEILENGENYSLLGMSKDQLDKDAKLDEDNNTVSVKQTRNYDNPHMYKGKREQAAMKKQQKKEVFKAHGNKKRKVKE